MQEYPSLLEKPYRAFKERYEAGDVRTAFSYMIDFFTTCESYFAIILAALYKKHKDDIADFGRITAVIQTIEDSRPLSLGSWDDIFHRLVDDARQQWPDNPFIKCLSEICYNKDNVFRGNGKSDPSFVTIRNDSFLGHDTTSSNNQVEKYIEKLTDRMERLKEASKSVVECGLDLSNDLHPLVHTDECGEYFLQTLKGNGKISFTSNDEDVKRKEVNVYNAAFETWIRPLLPSFEIRKSLSWIKICKCSKAETDKYIEHLKKKEGKYTPELFVERKAIEREFEQFVNSDKLFMPILGEAGQGKSNQLCHWAENRKSVDDFALILKGSDFADKTLPNKLREVFNPLSNDTNKNFNGWDFPEMLALFCDAAQADNKDRKLFFFIDALNEAVHYFGAKNNESIQTLFQDIYSQFKESSGNRVKVIFTCRSYTWRKQIAPLLAQQKQALFFTQDNGSPLTLTGFQDDEMRRAYENYKQKDSIQTEYDSLPLQCRFRLKDPLLLNFACQTYHGKPLPTHSQDFTSIALFNQLLDKKREYDNYGSQKVGILETMAEILFDSFENGVAADSIGLPSKEHPNLHKLLYYNNEESTAFNNLEKDKTFISNTGSKIQFVYERFMEFMLARHCYLRERAKLQTGEPIPANIIKEIFDSTKARNEVFVNVMQNVLIMDYANTGNPETIIHLLKDYGDDFEIYNLVSATLNVMILENYEADLFKLQRALISHISEDDRKDIKDYNKNSKTIDAELADAEIIEEHARLTNKLAPLIRLRTLAAASIVNGMLLTDYNNNNLYSEDVYELLWQLMEDPIVEVRNTACMLAYYVSGKNKTLTGTPLEHNISEIIIDKMHNYLLESTLFQHISKPKRRTRAINFLETATRLNVLRIIDLMLTEREEDRAKALGYLEETRNVVKHITYRYRVVKVMMPFLKIIIKRQLTFQSAYVNNLNEYAAFWESSGIPKHAPNGEWSRERMVAISNFFYLYSRYFDHDSHTLKPDAPDFKLFEKDVLSAYTTGDSFSYFVLERILVVVGIASWETVASVIEKMESVIKKSKWPDYTQMSFIYILYQLGLKMDKVPDILLEMLERNCEEWTERCRGYFEACNSGKANGLKLYKRNVMTWYACVRCAKNGDIFEDESVPLFSKLINKAIDNHDKELLVHLIQNISELITDSGLIHTALGLLKIILKRICDEDAIKQFEDNFKNRKIKTDPSEKLTTQIKNTQLIPLIGKVLGTAMNYYPQEVTDFLTFETHDLTFPGIQKYRDEILGFNPGGEKLPDLFTHKFGNFIIWALIHEQNVDDTVVECLAGASKTKKCLDFFDKGVRIVFEHLFKCKL